MQKVAEGKQGMAEEKDAQDYTQGQYLPVKLLDRFKRERYLVLSKLGESFYSNVWLAMHTELEKNVALKIQKSGHYFTKRAFHEIAILEAIRQGDSDEKNYAVKLLDDFSHIGANGQHVCMVFELLGDDLSTFLRNDIEKGIPLPKVKEICFNVLKGLDYLHEKCEIIHTNLKPENIFILRSQDLGMTATEGFRANKKARLNQEAAVLGFRGKQKTLLQRLGRLGGQHSGILQCKIADLGNACWTGRTHKQTKDILSTNYKCLETLLQSNYSTSADMWSFACIAFEFATGDFLFNPRSPGVNDSNRRYDIVEDHLALMIELLGEMPKTVALGGKLSPKYFDEDGRLKGYRDLQPCSLVDVLRNKYRFSEKDANDFSDFLIPLLHFEPDKRSTASQALLHPWLNTSPHLLQPSSSGQTQKNDEVKSEKETTF